MSSINSDSSNLAPTNFFQKAQDNAAELEESLLGPNYKYFDHINTPAQMGMSSSGSISSITKNISGLIGYVTLLSSGGGRASQVDGPLGNKFFLETGAKCSDKASGESVTRSIYVNNVPDGSIPFISQGLGDVNFSEFKGLIPGTLSNLSQINPMQIFGAFMSGTNPECQAITMETVDVNNIKGSKTAYVTTTDIGAMSSCWFPNKSNPVSGNRCRETFTTMRENKIMKEGGTITEKDFLNDPEFMGDAKEYDNYVKKYNRKYGIKNKKKNVDYSKMPNDPIVKLYYSSLGLLLLYIFFKVFQAKQR